MAHWTLFGHQIKMQFRIKTLLHCTGQQQINVMVTELDSGYITTIYVIFLMHFTNMAAN